jgi:hypothetical protein
MDLRLRRRPTHPASLHSLLSALSPSKIGGRRLPTDYYSRCYSQHEEWSRRPQPSPGRHKGAPRRQGKIEYHGSRIRKAVDVSFKALMQDNITGLYPKPPMIACLFVASGENNGRVGMRMAMPIEDRRTDGLPHNDVIASIPVCLAGPLHS